MWPVRRLLHKRMKRNGKVEYLVEWEGEYSNSWEPEKNITPLAIEEFEKIMKQSQENKRYPCQEEKCYEVFSKKSDLNQHVMACHRSDLWGEMVTVTRFPRRKRRETKKRNKKKTTTPLAIAPASVTPELLPAPSSESDGKVSYSFVHSCYDVTILFPLDNLVQVVDSNFPEKYYRTFENIVQKELSQPFSHPTEVLQRLEKALHKRFESGPSWDAAFSGYNIPVHFQYASLKCNRLNKSLFISRPPPSATFSD